MRPVDAAFEAALRRAVRVTTADEAAARDADAIASGTASFTLMCAAGTVATAEIVRVASDRLAHGVTVWCGAGNNGGDGYVVAAQLARLGVRVHVIATSPPRTPDAQRAASLAAQLGVPLHAMSHEAPAVSADGVIIDALLGTGARGALREDVARAAAHIADARARGACIVSLDTPTGVDATTGAPAECAVHAHVTITFGTLKHGLLSARGRCGRVVVADIGLGAHAARDDDAALLADASIVQHVVPPVAWNAHKGSRGRVCIVGGTAGMAGAVQLAARGALASGAGLVRALVHPLSAAAMQSSVPAVVCVPATTPTSLADTLAWAHAVLIGPGLGRDADARTQLRAVLDAVLDMSTLRPTHDVHDGASHAVGFLAFTPPVLVLDADALVIASDADVLPLVLKCAARTPVVLTPHAGEFARLALACGTALDERTTDPTRRLAAARHVAAASGACVVLKGTPTCCVAPDGTAWCVPRGTAALATGGTGDMLAGVIGALLAHARARGDVRATRVASLAAAAAYVHGTAAEGTADTSPVVVRGHTVETLLARLPDAWAAAATSARRAPGVLASLPDVRPMG